MTVKMRVGPKDDKKIAHNLIPRVADWGASAITIHGRSRQVMDGFSLG
jgi:tRNA-dihydrouridine synthase 3